jgi:hypothetical protein
MLEITMLRRTRKRRLKIDSGRRPREESKKALNGSLSFSEGSVEDLKDQKREWNIWTGY